MVGLERFAGFQSGAVVDVPAGGTVTAAVGLIVRAVPCEVTDWGQ